MKIHGKAVACLLGILAVFAIHILWVACLIDDAFISFRYAFNWAQTGSITWNQGQPPVEGFTNFLWVAFNAAACWLGLSMPVFSVVVGCVAGGLTLLLTWRFGLVHLEMKPGFALLAPFFLALSGPMVMWPSSGMETTFFGLLVLLALERFGAYWRRPRPLTLALAFFILFWATLTRPEGFFLAGLLAGLTLLRALLPEGRLHGLNFIKSFPAYAVPFVIYYVWRYNYFGYPLPNTFYAKTGGTVFQWIRGVKYVRDFSAYYLFCLCVIFVCLPVWRWTGLKGLRVWLKNWRACSARSMSVLTMVVVLAVYSAYIIYVGGDYMPMFRFYTPLMPLIYLLFALVLEGCWPGKQAAAWRRWAAGACVGVAAAGTLFPSTPLEPKVFPDTWRHHGGYRGVLSNKWHQHRLSLLGECLKHRMRSKDDSVATDAAGIMGYILLDHVIYDNQGLTDTHIAHMKSEDLGRWIAGHEKNDYPYILSKQPTFLVCDRFLHEQIPPQPRWGPDIKSILDREYDYTAQWLEDKGNNEAGYFCFYERKPGI